MSQRVAMRSATIPAKFLLKMLLKMRVLIQSFTREKGFKDRWLAAFDYFLAT
jgi:hypothetical protein